MNNNNVISQKIKIGKNFKIGSFCVIEDDCVFGDNVTIENFTHIKKGVIVGNNTTIGNYCEIGEDNKIGNNVIVQGRIRTAEKCIMEDNVTIKYGTILTSKVLLKNGSFLGPNVITLGSTHKRETIHGTVIGERTYIGAGSKLLCGVQVCADTVVGALSFVNKDVTEKGIHAGIPTKKIK